MGNPRGFLSGVLQGVPPKVTIMSIVRFCNGSLKDSYKGSSKRFRVLGFRAFGIFGGL